MKEKLKRSLGLLLALVMVASMFPVSVFAEEAEPISTEAVDSVIDEILTAVGEETLAPAAEEAAPAEKPSFASNVIGPLQPEEEPETVPEPEAEPEPVAKKLYQEYRSVDGNVYGVTMTYNDDANLPENAVLIVREIVAGTPEFDAYVAESAEALGWEDGIAEAVVLDISIYADGAKIEPAAGVNVEINLVDREAEEWSVVHFDKEEAPEVIEAAAEGEALTFETESFSPYVIAKPVIITTINASDGNTYQITLSYDQKAGIPNDSKLVVKEILQEVMEDSSEYDEYLERVENTLPQNQRITFVRFFDITIVSPEGAEIEPKDAVSVNIELVGLTSELKGKAAESVKAIHFDDEGNIEPMGITVTDETVSFRADGFSVYAFYIPLDIIDEYKITAHSADSSLQDIDIGMPSPTYEYAYYLETSDGNAIDFTVAGADWRTVPLIEGFEYRGAKYASKMVTIPVTIEGLVVDEDTSNWQYRLENGDLVYVDEEADIYFIFER